MQIYRYVTLTLGATPSSDVAGVFVGQDLTRGGQGGELDVVVERSVGGQTQESNVPPEGQILVMLYCLIGCVFTIHVGSVSKGGKGQSAKQFLEFSKYLE